MVHIFNCADYFALYLYLPWENSLFFYSEMRRNSDFLLMAEGGVGGV